MSIFQSSEPATLPQPTGNKLKPVTNKVRLPPIKKLQPPLPEFTFNVDGTKLSETDFRIQLVRKARKQGGENPIRIFPNHPIYLWAYAGDGQRFAALFRETWARIPLGVRREILKHWRSAQISIPLPFRPHIELFPSWSSRHGPGRLRGVLAGAYGAGLSLKFCSEVVTAFPDNLVRDLIAHELAHVVQAARGGWDSFSTLADCEEDADETMEAWGFTAYAIDKWYVDQCLIKPIYIEDLPAEQQERALKRLFNRVNLYGR